MTSRRRAVHRKRTTSRRTARRSSADEILDKVVERYLTSRDFNGLPVSAIESGENPANVTRAVVELVQRGQVTIEFGDRHPNPHIKCFEEEPAETALRTLVDPETRYYALYPSRSVLASRVDKTKYEGRPYTLELALGEGQLAVRYFDLSVLETYRSDPRFLYDCNDVGGRFAANSEPCETGSLQPRDQVHIQDFGFAYSKTYERCAAAFLRYLTRLSPEHQQTWRARQLSSGDWQPHPGWWASAMGHWPARIPLFTAFLAELRVINEMCRAIGWRALFREDFTAKPRPKDFAFLLRPTLGALNAFVHLLDKVMSDNLDKAFFADAGLLLDRDVPRADGKIRVEQRGTIQLLDEWLHSCFEAADNAPLEECIATFREVRQLRQKPAHAVDEDRYDAAFYAQQRELMIRAYRAMKTLRLVLACHPATHGVEVPTSLKNGAIYPF